MMAVSPTIKTLTTCAANSIKYLAELSLDPLLDNFIDLNSLLISGVAVADGYSIVF